MQPIELLVIKDVIKREVFWSSNLLQFRFTQPLPQNTELHPEDLLRNRLNTIFIRELESSLFFDNVFFWSSFQGVEWSSYIYIYIYIYMSFSK